MPRRSARRAPRRQWTSIPAALAVLAALCAPAAGQGFSTGSVILTPTVGTGALDEADLAIGARIEWGYRALPDLGNGVLGIQVSADFYSWDEFGYSFDYYPVGAALNYHFALDSDRFDPFLGAGLGYSIVSCDRPEVGDAICENNTLYVIARVGVRYYLEPNFAIYVDAGAGAATVNAGLSLRVR